MILDAGRKALALIAPIEGNHGRIEGHSAVYDVDVGRLCAELCRLIAYGNAAGAHPSILLLDAPLAFDRFTLTLLEFVLERSLSVNHKGRIRLASR